MSHNCPLCGLRFRFASELDQHARDDHIKVELDEKDATITRYTKSSRPVHGTFYDNSPERLAGKDRPLNAPVEGSKER